MSNAELAKIHIAKKQLNLNDDDYRAILERVTGRATSKGMTANQHAAVLAEFNRLGWKVTSGNGTARASGNWRKKSQKRYVRKIFAMWTELKDLGIWRDKRRASLIKFVKELTDIDDPEFLDPKQAGKVIEALKAMKERN